MYNKRMIYEWDENKNATNLSKHKIDFNRVVEFEWDSAFEYIDDRQDYGETRYCALGYIDIRIFHLTFTYRDEGIRVISLRKATKREEKQYAEA